METLADWIQRRGPLPPNEAVGWIIRLAKHVEALHEHGVAHGNVSPACVLLASADPRTPGFMSDVRKTIESLPFHSPERIRGGQISPSDDVWAVAATLYTALTAAPPFVGASENELRQQVLKGAPAPLSVYGVDDERLERLMGMSFSADAGRRLSNVALFRRELERVHPSPAGLEALEDEEVGDEDQAATAMLAVGQAGAADSRGAASMKALFAPPSFQADSRVAPVPAAEPSDFDTNPPPPAAGDATVMRELPAHIMAMAARAAGGGSNPPPADGAPDKQPEPPSAPKPAGPPRPGAPPSAPRPPMAPPRVPQFSPAHGGPNQEALSAAATVAVPVPAPPRPQAPTAPVAPVAPAGPRPGFAPPPNAPPAHGPTGGDRDPDDVRTVMHAGDIRSLLDASSQPQQAPTPGASPFGPASPPRPQPPQPPGRPPQAPVPPATPSQQGSMQMQAPLKSGGTARPPGAAPPVPPAAPGPRPAPSTQMGLGAAEAARAAPPPPAPEPRIPSTNSALEDEDDEDDGARTMMRESPILSPMQMGPRPAAGGPPKRPSQDEPTQTESQFAGAREGFTDARLAAENSFAGGAPGPWGAAPAAQPGFSPANAPQGTGVSALIAEALDAPKPPGDGPQGGSANEPAAGGSPGFGGFGSPPNVPGFGGAPGGFGQPGFGAQFPQQPGFGPGGGTPGFGAPTPTNTPGFGAPNANPPQGGFGSPGNFGQGGFNPAFGQNPGAPGFGDPTPGHAQHNPAFPTGEPTTSGPAIKLKQGRSYGSLILICVLVLVLAAAVTFIVLKYRDKLGLGSLDAPAGSWPSLVAEARLPGCASAPQVLSDAAAVADRAPSPSR